MCQMKTITEGHKQLLREQFQKTANEYLTILLQMFEWDSYYGYWSDGAGSLYCYAEDHVLTYDQIRFIVENDVDYSVYLSWHDYCSWCRCFDFEQPNLPSWVKGCPRLTKEQMNHLDKLRKDFEDTVAAYKNKNF